jgi:hypothetical protein
MKRTRLKLCCLTLLTAILFAGCATISPFDQYAYVQVTSVKVDVLDLMDKSGEPYANHEKAVEEVNSKLFKIIEYEKHRPKNQITIKMWDKLIRIDSLGRVDETTMIPSYWKKWKKDGKEGKFFIEEAKGQVGTGFDLIAELESNKIKAADAKVSSFISNK